MIEEAIVLVGGRGTRLRCVLNDRPKAMIEVGGRPFLEWLLLALRAQGIGRAVLSTGYRGEAIEEYFRDGARWGLEIAYSREAEPLGTAGAVRLALQRTRSDPLLAMNGDSYCPLEIARLVETHAQRNARVTLWLVEVEDCARFGSVEIGPDGQILAFHEKSSRESKGLINAGVYVFNREAISEIPAGGMISLEEEIFPGLIGKGLYGLVGHGPFLDIGTPESYAAAASILPGEFQRLEKEGAQERTTSRDTLDRELVRRHLLASAEVKRRIAAEGLDSILAAAQLIARTFQDGGKVLLCGNGGSAADCQHMATEFVSRLRRDFERPGLPAIALTTNTSFLTAYANDCGFEGVFERQLRALGKSGDVLIGISTSGNSGNVIRAVEAARDLKMRTIVLTGCGGRLLKMADVVISVPSEDTQHIQEAHLGIEHAICDLVERFLFGGIRTEADRNP